MPTGVYKHKKGKLSNALGKHWKLSEETKRKMRVPHIGSGIYKRDYNKIYTIERNKKISESKKGKKLSKEWKKNISKAQIGMKKPWVGEANKRFKRGFKKGHPDFVSKNGRKKQAKKIKKEKNWNWQGGISFEPYSTDWTDNLKEAIRKRDNYICQLCGLHQDELNGWHKKFDCHHIDYDKMNLNPENLITLCRSCHIKTNYNRKYWHNYFLSQIKKLE